jgi:DGQHR domain-containing protein
MEKRAFFGCKIAQRGEGNSVEFVVFIANAQDIMKWAGIRRVGEHDKGTQRILKASRVRQISRFLDADERNTLPSNITLAFSKGAAKFKSLQEVIMPFISEDYRNRNPEIMERLEWGMLSFEFEEDVPEHKRLALIVDGQHRLHGMAEYREENLPVLVSALIDASPEEQAFQFVVINNKSSKVPTDNVKALVASQLDESELQKRLLNAGVQYGKIAGVLKEIDEREDSPFRNMLDWPLNEKEQRLISLTALEFCLKGIRKKINILDSNDDAVKETFIAIWRMIKEEFVQLWGENDKFLSKVNIIALNDYIAQKLAFAWEFDLIDIHKIDQIESHTRITLAALESEFWEKDWTGKLQDSVAFRMLIKNDLQMIAQNSKNPSHKWYTGLTLPEMK